ncbi:MAG TPA: YkgJ family cysteine cluster protein [Verrucomicrobiae bacterium]|nr:YkgJ family cysteine cluster protein [Verrucomicrobiae bacterium]
MKTITGTGRVRIGEDVVELKFTVPKEACTPDALLPGARELANAVAALGEARAHRAGFKISCAKGCGACCRQLVPISPTEARALAALVAALPPQRAAAVRQRFADALSRMEAAGLLDKTPATTDKDAYREYGLAYFRQGVACPFLEDESCSIHANRPLVCREYQVTSPPAACAKLGSGEVRQVAVPIRVWAVFSQSVSSTGEVEWMPLIEALRFADANPEADRSRTGPQRVDAFLRELNK